MKQSKCDQWQSQAAHEALNTCAWPAPLWKIARRTKCGEAQSL